MKVNKVLVPVDGSNFSLQVLPQVTRLLDPATTKLVLLRVAPEPETVEVGEVGDHLTIYSDQRAAGMESEFAREMLPHVHELERAGFSVSTAMRFGSSPAQQIESFIAQEQIDMVAMTTHGRTGLARVLLGSVAEQVVHSAALPVLLYRPFGKETAAGEPAQRGFNSQSVQSHNNQTAPRSEQA